MSLGAVTANKSDFAKQAFDFGGPSPFEEILPEEPEEVKEEFNALTENVLLSCSEIIDC